MSWDAGRFLKASDLSGHRTGSARGLVLAALIMTVAGLSTPVGKTLAAGSLYWDYPESFAFDELDLQGVAIDAHGRLTAGLASEEFLSGSAEVYWRAVFDNKGGFYVASGHAGQIWHVDRKGASRLVATVSEPEIFSLLYAGGFLYAGGGPDGLLYRLSSDGASEIWADLPEGYIWAVVQDERGSLFVAAGSPATVYRIDGRLELKRLAKLPAANALDLAVDTDGTLLVVTQGPGLLYRLDPDGDRLPRVLHEAEQDELRQLVRGPQGQWHVLALSREDPEAGGAIPDPVAAERSGRNRQQPSNNGGAMLMVGGRTSNDNGRPPEQSVVYWLDDAGLVRPVWGGEMALLCLAYSESFGWLGAGPQQEQGDQSALFVLEWPRGARPLATWREGDVLDLKVMHRASDRQDVIACLAQPARLMRFTSQTAQTASAISEPLDGGHPIHWGRLSYESEGDQRRGLRWSVRGGQRSVPDDTWTAWSDSWQDVDHAIDLAPCRFLQWRVEFVDRSQDLTISAVTISGHEPNRPPAIYQFQLETEGEITLGGLMSSQENVTETFQSGLKVEYSTQSRHSRRADIFKAAPMRPLRTFSWLAGDPNEDTLEFTLHYQRLGEQTWRPIGQKTREFVGSWDTSSVPDGLYVVRLIASDKPGNPLASAQQTERLSPPIRVDNTPPRIENLELRRTAEGIRVRFRAEDKASPIAQARIEFPDGSRERIDPGDRICDSKAEDFDLELTFPRPGQPGAAEPWRVRVEVADRQGNAVAEEGEAR